MRIRVARAARRHPLLLDMLRDGRLHLSAIVRLLPVLTRENRDALLARATFCSKRQILEIVAELSPRPDAPARMRKLPQQRNALLPTVAHQALPTEPALAPSAGVLPNSPSVGVPPSQAGVDAPVRRAEADREPDRTGVQRADRLCPDTVAAASAPALTRLVSSPTRHRSSNPCRPAVTGSSSPPAPSSTTSSSGCGRSCVPRSPMATSPRSSTTPSARRSRGSRPAASRRRALLARRSRTRAPPRLRDTCRRPYGVPCASGTGLAAASSTRKVGAAPSGTGSSSTTGIPSAWAETTIRETSACSAGRTTSCWRAATTACSRRPDATSRGPGRRPLRCQHLPRTGQTRGKRRLRTGPARPTTRGRGPPSA